MYDAAAYMFCQEMLQNSFKLLLFFKYKYYYSFWTEKWYGKYIQDNAYCSNDFRWLDNE